INQKSKRLNSKRFYGWKPSLPDHRDMQYAFIVPPNTLRNFPPSINLDPLVNLPMFDPAWDQGQLGACGPGAEGELLVFNQLPAKPKRLFHPSRLFLYYTTRVLLGTVNEDSGVDNRTMLKACAKYGWCPESLWPYDISKFTIKPPTNCFSVALRRRITLYQAVAQDLNTMKGCLALFHPFIFGF